MRKFVILSRSESVLSGMSVSDMISTSTPEQMKAGMAVWQAWHIKCAGAIVDLGTPLDKSITVTKAGSEPTSKSTITGYTILQAESMEEVVAPIKDHPHFQMLGSTIEILESVPMPGPTFQR